MKTIFKILVVGIISSYSVYTSAQQYQPVLENTYWNVLLGNGKTDSVGLGNDTIMGGKVYRKINSRFFTLLPLIDSFFIREDTLLQKVWVKFADSSETLLYDFSLQPGDSIKLKGWFGKMGFDPSLFGIEAWFKLDSISIRIYQGIQRKVYYLSNGLSWVSGIGSTWGLLSTYSPGLFLSNFAICNRNFNYYLLCTHQNGVLKYKDCTECNMTMNLSGVDDPEKKLLVVYPNPASDQITIEVTDFSDHNLRFVLLDATGRTVSNGMVGDKTRVSLQGLQNGVYTLSITSPTFSTVKKIIKL